MGGQGIYPLAGESCVIVLTTALLPLAASKMVFIPVEYQKS